MHTDNGGQPGDGQPRSSAGGAQRILEAAIAVFGERGVAAASLKSVAERAEVSAALIIHHYGSKDGLRTACDIHVATLLRKSKSEALAEGTHLSPFMALNAAETSRPAMRYLARTLTDGSPHTNELIDDLFTDALGYTGDAVRSGLLRPSSDPDARVAILLIMSMGTLVLHEHLERLIGESFVMEGPPPMRYVRTVLEVFSDGLFSEDAYEELRGFADSTSSDPAKGTQ